MNFLKIARFSVALTIGVLASLTPAQMASAAGSTTLSYNFDAAGQLTNDFQSYVDSGTVNQAANGGINDTGSISTNEGAANAVFQPKAKFTIGPVGSSYSFSSFMKSTGPNGYSGFGFTATTPSAATDSNVNGGPFRPIDALGISVHGGGYVFHNESVNTGANWDVDTEGVTTVKKTSNPDLLGTFSPDDWYRIIFTIDRTTQTTFDIGVEVFPCNSAGVLVADTPEASFRMLNQAAPTLLAADYIYSYINFSGFRVTNFDNFATTVDGGVEVEGAPEGSLTGDFQDEVQDDSLANTGGSAEGIAGVSALALGMIGLGLVVLHSKRYNRGN
jgi:hypothetical protein